MNLDAIESIHNFLKLSEKVATAGQPTEEELRSIARSGYQVIVNLALPESPKALPNEKSIVESLNMEYVHIPVVWENPTFEDIDRFFSVMQNHANKSVFVHCAANMRVSSFIYLYRLLSEGINEETAKSDLHRIWVPNQQWQEFIDRVIQHYRSPAS